MKGGCHFQRKNLQSHHNSQSNNHFASRLHNLNTWVILLLKIKFKLLYIYIYLVCLYILEFILSDRCPTRNCCICSIVVGHPKFAYWSDHSVNPSGLHLHLHPFPYERESDLQASQHTDLHHAFEEKPVFSWFNKRVMKDFKWKERVIVV